jgi:hypothetical protein
MSSGLTFLYFLHQDGVIKRLFTPKSALICDYITSEKLHFFAAVETWHDCQLSQYFG